MKYIILISDWKFSPNPMLTKYLIILFSEDGFILPFTRTNSKEHIKMFIDLNGLKCIKKERIRKGTYQMTYQRFS